MKLENLLKKIKKGKKFIRNALIAGLVSSSLLFTSCPSPPPEPEPPPDKENELSENTQVLPEQDILKITALYDNEITLSEPISYLSSGDIIVGDISDVTPNGFLRKVEYISGDGRIIYTEPASLEEALKSASFEYQGKLSPMNVHSLEAKSGVSEELLTPQSLLDFNINLNNVVLFDFDGNESTTWDQIIANGNISFNSDFYLKFKIRDLGLKQLVFKNITNEDSKIEISTLNNLDNIDGKIRIAKYNFPSFIAGYLPTIPPFPVIITPQIEVYVGLNGDISPIKTSVTQSANLTAGLAYESGKGWSIIKEFENSFSWVPPNLPEISYFKAYAGPRLNFLVYGIGGPYGELDGYLKLDANQSPWKLYGGLEALLGVKMRIFSWNIADYSAKVIDYVKLLTSGEISEPPLDSTEKIIFQSNRDENSEIYIMNIDGRNPKNLTNNFAADEYSKWSPNRDKIVFVSTRDGIFGREWSLNYEIYTMNADGTNIQRLTNNSYYDHNPAWSPDGKEIIFVSTRDDISYQLYIMNADGTNQRRLSTNNFFAACPSFSPDGKRIVFEGSSGIRIFDRNNNTLTSLPNPFNAWEYDPSFSLDGSKIVFVSDEYGDSEIYTMGTNGLNRTHLTSNFTTDWFPSWSSDGSKILFSSNRDGNYEIYIMNSDGSNQQNLTKNSAADISPN